LNNEDQIILLCTRQNFDEVYINKVKNHCQERSPDWQAVFNTSRIHGIAPLVFRNLSKIGLKELEIPESVINNFKILSEQNDLKRNQSAKNLDRVIRLLDSKSIPVMLIKGEALSQTVYEDRFLVTMADVDLLIKPKEEDLEPAIRQQIFDLFEEINQDTGEIKEYLEFDFYMHHDLSMNGILPVDADRIWRDALTINFRQQEIAVMSIEDALIASAINACRKRYFRLKSCFDIAEIVSTYPDIDWDLLSEKSLAYQCNFILYTALCVTNHTIGLSCRKEVFDKLQVNIFRKSIIQRLIIILTHNYSLTQLISRAEKNFLGRKFSLSLFLTYSTYRWKQIILKWIEIFKNRNNPHGWDPGII
jgi:adenosyl cobinamide kinase/adenosyl cobinamide phosphate guanylyltransferase